MLNIKEYKNHIVRGIMLISLFSILITGYAQESEPRTDSLYAARLMQDNLELYGQIDSLNLLIKGFKADKLSEVHQIDSLKEAVIKSQASILLSTAKTDTLEVKRLRLQKELLSLQQQMLSVRSTLEEKLQVLRDKETQLAECKIKLLEARSEASLNEAKLSGKIDVNTTKVEAKDRELTFMQQSIKEKDRIISEKTLELEAFYREKGSSLLIIDSLSRVLNLRELELAKVSERLRIIEGQYNEMLDQRTEAQNKKKKIRFVQGVGLKSFRTPDYQLAPQSSTSTTVYVITNKNAGKIEFDYITGISLSLYDLSKPDGKYTYDAGMFIGFGGTNLFKNFYLAPTVKVFDFIHLMLGLNFAEYQQLQPGFNIGDPLLLGTNIPTVKKWKGTVFLGMTVDFELLSNIPKKL